MAYTGFNINCIIVKTTLLDQRDGLKCQIYCGLTAYLKYY